MKSLFLVFVFLCSLFVNAQAGMTVSPGKLFFFGNEGNSVAQKIRIINPTDRELEVGVSINDWRYDFAGGNEIAAFSSLPESAASWVRINPGTHVVIPGNSFKEIEVNLAVPSAQERNHPVHTAMIFLTQLNPSDSQDASGAAIKVAVRIGVKVYHAISETSGELSVNDLTASTDDQNRKWIHLSYSNTGTTWTDGKVAWSVFSYNTGKTIPLGEQEFYTLPKDRRESRVELPADLASGKYTITARVTYEKNKTVQLAELDFEL